MLHPHGALTIAIVWCGDCGAVLSERVATRDDLRALTAAGVDESTRALELVLLAERCTCGHDRGDHLADAPHACEPCNDRGKSCACFTPRTRLALVRDGAK